MNGEATKQGWDDAAPAETAAVYTAGQIAAALGVRRQSVQSQLASTRHDATSLRHGNPSKAWTILGLPQPLRVRLDASAHAQGYRNAEHLMSSTLNRWEPPVAWAKVGDEGQAKAAKLRDALRYVLENQTQFRSATEMERRGLQDYQRAFGHAVDVRHWRRLFKRTIIRDRGQAAWDRVDIYLDERPALRRDAQPGVPPEFCAALDGLLANLAGSACPSSSQRSVVWVRSFEILESLCAAGRPERKAKSDVVRYLSEHAGFLAKNESALRRVFNQKLITWRSAGRAFKAIEDGRHSNSGKWSTPKISEEDLLPLLRRIAICGGRISQGWREALAHGEVPPELIAYYGVRSGSKSYVPNTIRNMIRGKVRLIDDWMHGPHRAKMNGPHIDRDWSSVDAGSWFQADDTTLPVYYWDEEKQAKMRGQFLVMVDVRTEYVLAWVLISNESYNSHDILGLITHAHDLYGLPRCGFYFENSVWRARLLTGHTEPGFESFAWDDTEAGLRRFGIRFMHAREARAKVVERVIGAIQTHMERDLSYVGRDERHDRYERAQQHLRHVESGRMFPTEALLTKTEWGARIDEIVNQFNDEIQQGKKLNGLSPRQGYAQFYGRVPLQRLNESNRYLLASLRKRVEIRNNGISFKHRGEVFTYKNEITGRHRGETFNVWFDPQRPEFVCVSDLDEAEPIPFVVERAVSPPAMDPDSPLLEVAHRQNAAHMKYGHRLYRTVARDFPEDFQRRMTVDMTPTVEAEILGKRMQAQMEDARAKGKRRSAGATKGAATLRELGFSLSDKPARADDQLAAAQELKSLLEEAKKS